MTNSSRFSGDKERESVKERLSQIEAILLDVDGTVVDRDAAHRRFMEKLVSDNQGALPRNASPRDTLDILITEDERGRRNRLEFAEIAVECFPDLAWTPQQFLDTYFENIGRFVEKRDWVVTLLDELRQSYRLAAVSNGGSENQRRKLEMAGSLSLFDTVLISQELGSEKPDSNIFEFALRALRVESHQALHVGDDEISDVGGAQALGILACWVSHSLPFPSHLPPPDLCIESVAELKGLLLPK